MLPSYQLSETPVTPALKTVGITSCFMQQRTRGCKNLLNASFSIKFFKSIFHLCRCPLSTNHFVKDILIRPGQKLFIELSLLSGYSWPIPLQDIQIDRHNSNETKFSLSRYFFLTQKVKLNLIVWYWCCNTFTKWLNLNFDYTIYNWSVKINECNEKVLKPKSNLAFSTDFVHLNLITHPCLFLKLHLNFPLILADPRGRCSH